MSDPLNDFGREMMTRVRDGAMLHYELLLAGRYRDAASARLLERLRSCNGLDAATGIIPEVVNTVLFQLLQLIEEERRLRVLFDGVEVRELSYGLPSQLWGDDGWIKKYSKATSGEVS